MSQQARTELTSLRTALQAKMAPGPCRAHCGRVPSYAATAAAAWRDSFTYFSAFIVWRGSGQAARDHPAFTATPARRLRPQLRRGARLSAIQYLCRYNIKLELPYDLSDPCNMSAISSGSLCAHRSPLTSHAPGSEYERATASRQITLLLHCYAVLLCRLATGSPYPRGRQPHRVRD
jgi:hypothetical protein